MDWYDTVLKILTIIVLVFWLIILISMFIDNMR